MTGRKSGGLSDRATRLAAIEADIARHHGRPDLSVAATAHQGATPRYVQMLFESEGVTFSKYVLGQRLAFAHRCSPTRAGPDGKALGHLSVGSAQGGLSPRAPSPRPRSPALGGSDFVSRQIRVRS